jgi:predicted DNA-binding protein
MTQELYERISSQAKKEEKKLNYLIREIIKDYLEYVDIKKGE